MGNIPFDPASPVSMVRLLLNDVDATEEVFTTAEIKGFLALEGGNVKLAAAQAIDTNANDQALAAKVLGTATKVLTDGAKLADALRKHADNLRKQVADELEESDGGFFQVVGPSPTHHTELTNYFNGPI